MALIDDIRALRIADYDYPLPDERIAKHPLAQREQCKLLYYNNGAIEERKFWEVPSLLPKRSTLIYNNTRVINARCRATMSRYSRPRTTACGSAWWATASAGNKAL